MIYTVTYKRKNDFFKKKLTKVIGDGIMEDSKTPTRYFIQEDNTRIEVPVEGTIFTFSPVRFLLIKQNMEKTQTNI